MADLMIQILAKDIFTAIRNSKVAKSQDRGNVIALK